MAIPPALRDTQFNCTPGGGGPECPDCGPSLSLSLQCCPTPGNPSCVLTCDTPVLLKACGGTPPYTFSGDDDFVTITPVDVDKVLVTLHKAFFQYGYTLRYVSALPGDSVCDNPSVYSNNGAYVMLVGIRQKNPMYDCDFNLIVGQEFGEDNYLVDKFECCECACIIAAPPDPSDNCDPDELDKDVLLVGFQTIAFIRNDIVHNARIHSTLGLDMNIIINGADGPSNALDPTVFLDFLTGVFVEVPRGPIDICVQDSLAALVCLPVA